MRLIILTTIDNRRESCCHLDHCHIIALSEGRNRKIGSNHVIYIVNKCIGSRLTGQINVGFQSDVKIIQIFHQCFLAHLLTNMHQGYVTGLLECLRNSDNTMSDVFMTFDRVTADLQHTVTYVRFVPGQLSGIKSRCDRHCLCNRSRLIRVGNTVISPDSVQRIIHGFIIHLCNLFF